MPKTTNERQADFVARKKDEGLVRVRVWVPKGKEDVIRSYAKILVEQARENHKGPNQV